MIAVLFLVRAARGDVPSHGSLLKNLADGFSYIRGNEVFSKIIAVALLVRHSRRQSIVGTKSRNRYFKKVAAELSLRTAGDDYFIQLEGTWKDTPEVGAHEPAGNRDRALAGWRTNRETRSR